LTQNKEAAADLLALALTRPRFDPEPVERMRRQFLIAIDGEQRDPNSAAFRVLEKKLLGDHPYARSNYGTQATMSALTADDLRQFVKDRLTREHLYVAAAGDINPADLGKLVDRAFAGLPAKGAPLDIPEAHVVAKGSLAVVERNIPQAVVLFAQPGVKRNDKDFFATFLMNYVLGGGGFSSRLMTELREKRGLTYGIDTDLVTLDHVGFINGRFETPNAKVKESLDLMREEWRHMAEAGPGPQELEAARDYLLGYYPRNLTTTSKAADTLLGIQMDHLGIDYMERRRKEISAVTLDDVKRVAKKLLSADALTIVVAGKPIGVESTEPTSAQ
jgi:zinc protease